MAQLGLPCYVDFGLSCCVWVFWVLGCCNIVTSFGVFLWLLGFAGLVLWVGLVGLWFVVCLGFLGV